MENQGIELGVKQVPASEAIQGTGGQISPTKPVIYPIVEEMTFRAVINSNEQGMALLRAVQIIVNEFGAATLIEIMNKVEAKPSLMQKAKSMLPFIGMM
jgi:hypothetical protein